MRRRREKGEGETKQGGYLFLPTIHRYSVYLGRRFGREMGGRGGGWLLKEEMRRTGGSGLFFFLSPSR